MRARVPASSANLGPGFDVLALALSLHLSVEVRPAAALEVVTEGEGTTVPADADHLAVRVASAVVGHERLAITISSEIPIRRGLGSSAALAVATAAAAGAADPFVVAAGFEGHLENAAASSAGGLVTAAMTTGGPVLRRLPLDPGLSFVVLVPDRELATADARGALGTEVRRDDAVFNLSRLGLLLAGLADRSLLLATAGEDRLHQACRARLFPEAPELLAKLLEAGALVSCWSGAGPSLLGICDGPDAAARARDGGESALATLGVAGRALVLEPDLTGLVLEE